MTISDDIYNYNEKLVREYFTEKDFFLHYSADFIDDLFCIVLNKLPPRYIRHEVDISFYMPSQEREDLSQNIIKATEQALTTLKENALKK
ncbi:MAG: late competence development ComFB family protein [Colwellia sp.]